MAETIMPVDTSFLVVNHGISSVRKGFLLVKDCLGYIAYNEVLRGPRSEINVSHIKPGLYQIELIVGQTAISRNIYIR